MFVSWFLEQRFCWTISNRFSRLSKPSLDWNKELATVDLWCKLINMAFQSLCKEFYMIQMRWHKLSKKHDLLIFFFTSGAWVILVRQKNWISGKQTKKQYCVVHVYTFSGCTKRWWEIILPKFIVNHDHSCQPLRLLQAKHFMQTSTCPETIKPLPWSLKIWIKTC